MNKNFSAMILAAGFGSRMKPLTNNLPKPLLDINGITLLDNAINFLKLLGCDEIIVNSHYHHLKIRNLINKRKDKNIITLIYEKKILDTGGAVKNAIPYFKNKNILLVNSDIFWQKENINDINKLITNYYKTIDPRILLVKKNDAFGISNSSGDFNLNKNLISRFTQGNEILFYTGLQMFNLNIFKKISKNKFSFNEVWDNLIINNKLFGQIMNSNWYHVGDIHGLTIAKNLRS